MELKMVNGMVALIDGDDFEKVSSFRWRAATHSRATTYYAQCTSVGRFRGKFLHRVIMNARTGELVDHRNFNGLDCRKENLRKCTPSQSTMNRRKRRICASQYKGVYRDKKHWRAVIQVDGKRIQLGEHKTEELAALAYNAAAKVYHGEFAVLNLTQEQD